MCSPISSTASTQVVSDPTPFREAAEGLLVDLRLQPAASRDRVDGPTALDDGAVVLKVRVAAAPEGGKANGALIKLLAKTWKLPKSSLHLVAGQTVRRKTLLVSGDAVALRRRLEAWLFALPKT